MTDDIVLAKAESAVKRCGYASESLLKHAGKRWNYLLAPHDEVKEHNTLDSYIHKYNWQNAGLQLNQSFSNVKR